MRQEELGRVESRRLFRSAPGKNGSPGLVVRLVRWVVGGNPVGIAALLAKDAAGTFVLKVVSSLLLLILTTLLTRHLGVTRFGVYAYAISMSYLLSDVMVLGLGKLLVRDVAGYVVRNQWNHLRGMIRYAILAAVSLSILTAAISGLLIVKSGSNYSAYDVIFLRYLPVIVVSMALIRLEQAVVRGLQRVVAAQVPQHLIFPVLALLLTLVGLVFFGEHLNADWAVGIHALAVLLAVASGLWQIQRYLPPAAQEMAPRYEVAGWTKALIPFFFLSAFQVINMQSNTVILGIMADSQAVGLFHVVKKGSELIAFIFFAFGTALTPKVARLYASGDLSELQQAVSSVARAMLILTFPIALLFIAFGKWLLMIFGADFVVAARTLAILSVGEVLHAAIGLGGLVLTMTGFERLATYGVTLGAIMNVFLNVLMIPPFGIDGAALASVLSVFLSDVVLALLAYLRLGVNSTPFGRRRY